MSRLPKPFLNDQGNHQQFSQRPPMPGFLLLTRPPLGSNSYGGARHTAYESPIGSSQTESFIPFSNIGNNSSSSDNNRHNSNRGGGKFNFNRGGSDHGRHGNHSSPRFAHPYQQSPSGRMPSPRGQGHGFSNTPGGRMPSPRGQGHGFNNTPGGRYNSNSGLSYSTPRGNFNNATPGGRFHSGNRRGRFHDRQDRSFSDRNRSNPNGNSSSGWERTRGPISSIPIDKFVSESMVQDPWAGMVDDELDSGIQVEEASPVIVSLDDSEIIIDSDTSVLVENSYEDVMSDTEVDSSSVHDTGSDSPNIATSSTSEKDTGSDSGSDT